MINDIFRVSSYNKPRTFFWSNLEKIKNVNRKK